MLIIKNLNKPIFNYDKADEIFNKISDKMNTAINNAKRLEQFHIDNGNIEDNLKNPSTQFYLLIETLINEKNFN
ncbi:hypothetical protein [Aphanothece sacrum]|uniref:CRISPR-associated protein Csm2 n=1 Tax=Aphanothece sacrum FPU1 TaxID=1920663 RepID=A0A401IFE4_APHSA|nr:hypothetical protein [Aphanothece sacrum]GBF80003.1 CRISPR-associated protein Csm2 [Aphanothece sacrum FPU1]GBF83777.1 CRISPR-associated protein, Csm2 family [Aphanothece sacrum FPU3]